MQPMMQQGGNPDDDKLFVQFYMGSLKDEEKSIEAGHPVFNPVPFIKIVIPGDRNCNIDTIASPQYQARFPRQWAQFQSNEKQEQPGLPLREWPGITRAQAEELQYLNITTVEQLATLPDVYGSRVMGVQDLKRKAATYLANAKDAAFATKLSEENAGLKNMIEALQAELKRLSDRVEKDQNEQPKQQSARRS